MDGMLTWALALILDVLLAALSVAGAAKTALETSANVSMHAATVFGVQIMIVSDYDRDRGARLCNLRALAPLSSARCRESPKIAKEFRERHGVENTVGG
jgi:hypothetical protein